MRKYLSYGGGVNSTALMILLKERGEKFESVFVDHGGDYPETYEYVEYLQGEGFPVTILKPKTERCSTIEEYCLKYGIKPLRQMRWCTDKFKLRPLREYIKAPAICFIGIDNGEKSRAYKKPLKEGITNKYPLIEHGIDREGCIKIIRKAGLKIPKRSGCWFCPFATKKEIAELKTNYPDLFRRRKRIIETANIKYAERNYNLLSNFMS